MSLNDSDKTVFKQPRPGGDRTVLRPTPGGLGGSQQPSVDYQPQVEQACAPLRPVVEAQTTYFRQGIGLNPLVNAASTLLAVFEKTRQSASHSDVAGLHQRLVNELKNFEMSVNEVSATKEIVASAHYILCSILDEAVLNTPWGAESPWAQRTLLTVFHNETSGGEKFFGILKRMRERPAENIDILELVYICLSLGFEGKYRLQERGRDTLEQIRDELFTIIRNHRGEYERTLSPNWQGLGETRNTLAEYIPMWVVISCVATALLFSYSGFSYWLYQISTPVVEQLREISVINQDQNK